MIHPSSWPSKPSSQPVDYLSTYPHVGSTPGTLRIAYDAHPTEITLINYNLEKAHKQTDLTPEDCHPYLQSPSVSWVDVAGLGSEDILKRIAEVFELDNYLLEDVVNVPHPPKVEEFSEQLLIITQMAIAKPKGQGFWLEQVSFVLGKNYVISFQEEPLKDCFDLVRDRIINDKGKIRHLGADYLCYALWDAIIDSYYPITNLFRDRIEVLEEEVLFNATVPTLEKIYLMKKELLYLHKAIWPQRHALEFLLQENSHFFSKKVRSGLRDCYDHTQHIMDSLDSGNSFLDGLINLYLSSISNQTNEVMKVLAVVSTIFIPLTFIAGIYGMNFNHDKSPYNMPELEWYWGYPLILLLMLTIAVGSILFFWRRGWFKSQIPHRRPPQSH